MFAVLGTVDVDCGYDTEELKKYRTIQDGNEQYYNDKTLKTSQAIWNINTKNRAK